MKFRFFNLTFFVLLVLQLSTALAQIMPPCASNPIANDYCASATPICNLNGYCGNTSAFYTNHVSPTNGSNETYTPLGNVFCATIQNNSWLKFIADSTVAVFNVWCFNCQNNDGIQMQIYATTDCYNFVAVSNCWNPHAQINGQITANGLTPGNVYYFMIDGTAGDICDYVIACDVGVNAAPAITPDDTICIGTTTTLTASGALTYYWTASPPDPTLSGQETHASVNVCPLVATTYSCIATNPGINTFCITDTTILSTVVSINNVTAQLSNIVPAHCNLDNGSITMSGIGGTGSYSYLWSTTPAQTTPTISNLAPGTYTLTISSGGCSSTVQTYLTSLAAPVAVVDTFSNNYCGQNNGSASISVTGGTPNFSYVWNTVPPQTTNLLQNVGSGLYTITVTDGWNCTATQTVSITDVPGPTVSLAPLAAICSDHVPFTLSGGNPAGGTYSGPAVVNNIFDPSLSGPGIFTITYTFTDNHNCTGQQDQSLEVLDAPEVTAPQLPALCVSAAPVVLSGGAPGGGTYSGTGVSGGVFNTAVAGVGSFDIIYTYSNSNGCLNSDTTTQVVYPLPQLMQAAIPNVCLNQPFLSLTGGGTPSGGTYSGPGVTFGSWFNPSMTGTGTFVITYHYADTNGCADSIHANVTVVDIPAVGLAPYSPVCQSSIPFLLTGGSPSGGFYSGLNINNGYFDPSSPASYMVTYTFVDTNGCSNDTTQPITVLNLPSVSFSSLVDLCIDHGPDTLSGGSPAGGTYSGTGVSNGIFSPALAGPGTFAIVYTYSDSLCSDTAQQSIVVRQLPTVTFSSIPNVCLNIDSVQLTQGSPTGGTYSGQGVNQAYFLPAASGMGTFNILYTYEDQYGCVNSAAQTVMVVPTPLRFHVGAGPVNCEDVGSPVTVDSSQLGVEYILILDGVTQGFPFTGSGSSFSFGNQTVEGTYHVIAQNISTGCRSDMLDSAVIKLIMLPNPHLEDSMSLCELHSIELDAGSYPDSVFYQWQDGSTGRYFTVEDAGIYWVRIGRGNCIATDSVEVWNCCQFEIANVFTPNGDQFNDLFMPKYYCELLRYKLEVFNRWGKRVYQSSDIDEGWDGTNSNEGSGCSEGTYFYVITYTSLVYPEIRTDRKVTGSVTLLR